MNVGLVGYGLAGSVFHAPLIQSVTGLKLAAVVTSRAEQLGEGLRVYPNLDDLLSDRSVGVVVIASPTALHFEHARAALFAGKHVVVDKPLSTTVKEADELIALASHEKRVLTVFQNRRWDGDFLTIQRLTRENALGHLHYYEAHFDRFRPQIKKGWREVPGPGSGILFDLGAHLIDQALCLFGMPGAVTADVLAQRADAQVDDYFHVLLDYGKRRAVLHASTLVTDGGYRLIAHGDAGSFLKRGLDTQEDALKRGVRPGAPDWGADDPQNYGELTPASGERQKIITNRGCYEHFYAALAKCLTEGAPPPVDPRDSRNGLHIIEAALRSSKERRTIAL